MRIRAIIVRILRQFRRDKRTLALIFIAPLFVLTLMNFVFNGNDYVPNIGVLSQESMLIHNSSKLDDQAKLKLYDNLEQAKAALENQDIDAILSADQGKLSVQLEGSDPTVNRAVLEALQNLTPNHAAASAAKPDISYLHGSSSMSSIDRFGPVLIGFFVFFFVFLIGGVSFLRERTTGTLERLLATPIKRSEIVLGYLGGFGLFTLVQALLISWFSIQVLGIMMIGSFGLVLVFTLLLALTALTLGTLLSAYANNELQMIQFIPLIIVPQLFLSGLFNIQTLPDWLQVFRYIMPLYFGSHGLTNIMIRGTGWSEVSTDVYILIGFCVLFTLLNIFALRKHRKI